QENEPATHDDGPGGESVAKLMDECAADIYVMRGTKQEKRNRPVHQHACGRYPDHDPGMDLHRMGQPRDGLIEKERRNCHKCQRIDERSQYTRAMIAVCLGRATGTSLKEDRHPGEQQCQQVGDVVPRFGKQRQAMGAQAGYQCHEDIYECRHERVAQRPGADLTVAVLVAWHIQSLLPAHELPESRRKKSWRVQVSKMIPTLCTGRLLDCRAKPLSLSLWCLKARLMSVLAVRLKRHS